MTSGVGLVFYFLSSPSFFWASTDKRLFGFCMDVTFYFLLPLFLSNQTELFFFGFAQRKNNNGYKTTVWLLGWTEISNFYHFPLVFLETKQRLLFVLWVKEKELRIIKLFGLWGGVDILSSTILFVF